MDASAPIGGNSTYSLPESYSHPLLLRTIQIAELILFSSSAYFYFTSTSIQFAATLGGFGIAAYAVHTITLYLWNNRKAQEKALDKISAEAAVTKTEVQKLRSSFENTQATLAAKTKE